MSAPMIGSTGGTMGDVVSMQPPVPYRHSPMVRKVMALQQFNDYYLIATRFTNQCNMLLLCMARQPRFEPERQVYTEFWHIYGLFRGDGNDPNSLFVFINTLDIPFRLDRDLEISKTFFENSSFVKALRAPIKNHTHPDLTLGEVNAINEIRNRKLNDNHTFFRFVGNIVMLDDNQMKNRTALGIYRDELRKYCIRMYKRN